MEITKFDIMRRWEGEFERTKKKRAYLLDNGYTVEFVQFVFAKIHGLYKHLESVKQVIIDMNN